jgi:hypothetical protein
VSTLFNTSYQWQINAGLGFQNLSNAGPYSGVNTAQLTITNTTASMHNNYYRCLVNYNNCMAYSDSVRLSLNTNTSVQPHQTIKYTLYPNPVNNRVNIQVDDNSSPVDIRIYTLTGQLLLQQSFNNNLIQIDLNSFSQGLYIVEVKSGNKTSYSRFIKQSE